MQLLLQETSFLVRFFLTAGYVYAVMSSPCRLDFSSKRVAHFDCCHTNKRLWPRQVNFSLAGAGQGAPRGGSDTEQMKCEFVSQASDSPGHSLQVEGIYSDVFFLFVTSGECLGRNRCLNNCRAPKGSEYFETTNGLFIQNTSPHEVEGDINFTKQKRNKD